jgi:CBS domain-containing protein
MIEKRIGCLPVVDGSGNLVGLITDRAYFPTPGGFGYTSGDISQLAGMWLGDLSNLEEAVRAARSKRVRELMTTEHISVHEDDPVSGVAELLVNDRIYHVAVVRGRKVVGIISRRDILKVFAGRGQ